MTKLRLHIWVSGKVQGVYFRGSTRELADKLGICGWVKNLDDGRVEALLEGEEEKVEQLMQFVREGPGGAEVHTVESVKESGEAQYTEFSVERARRG